MWYDLKVNPVYSVLCLSISLVTDTRKRHQRAMSSDHKNLFNFAGKL